MEVSVARYFRTPSD